MAIPIRKEGSYIISSYDGDCWLSGIALGKNLWNHAYNSAYNYHKAFNGGNPVTKNF